MKCKRCQGFMIHDEARTNYCHSIKILRCVQCGNCEDDIVLENRSLKEMPRADRSLHYGRSE